MEYGSSTSSCDEEDERLRPLPPLHPSVARSIIDVNSQDNDVSLRSHDGTHVASYTIHELHSSSENNDALNVSSTMQSASRSKKKKKPKNINYQLGCHIRAVDIDPAVIEYSKPYTQDASSQTIITGDILSLNFYQGNASMQGEEWTTFEDIRLPPFFLRPEDDHQCS